VADVVMILIRTPRRRSVREEIEPNLAPGDMVMFAHGSTSGSTQSRSPRRRRVDGAPKSPGQRVASCLSRAPERRRCLPSTRTPPAAPAADGCHTRRGWGDARRVIETTFKEETERNLFGEQAVLLWRGQRPRQGRVRDARRGGLSPEIAYFVVPARAELIVDLIYQERPQLHALLGERYGGEGRLHRDRASSPTRPSAKMRQMLAEIQNGTYAKA